MSTRLLSTLMLMILALPGWLHAANGMPDKVQDGNILHCFNWPISEVKNELPNIAAAGFGSVQLSPLQRADVRVGSPWHDLYRPYDLAFKGGLGSREELKALCTEAAKYGIKIIVDVVANHVDKTAGYHDTWWDSNGRVRWEGGINYGDRRSITHGQLGDYGDVNSELAEVAARGKAYVEDLKSMGVAGCRWDAAKHIGLPSEGCGFWTVVTSVPGMYHYGEILDAPGPNASIIKEYGGMMSVTDNKYSNGAARENGGIPYGYGGSWAVDYGLGDKVVYWGESHDTYANDEWSQNVDQSIIDRAWASFACRKGATALYLSRPNAKGFNNIKVGKGSTAFKAKHIAAVNKFRNAMVGKADYFSSGNNAISVTRQGGGAVIVMKGSGNVSIANGGGYCPAGTYTDMVSGGTFTVTASTISGNVGSSGIAVIMKDGVGPNPDPNPDPNPGPDPDPSASMWILGNLPGAAGWSTTPGTGMAMTKNGSTYTAKGVEFVAAAGETTCYFNLTDYVGSTWDDLNMTANRYGAATEGETITLGSAATIVKYANGVDASGCLSWTVAPGKYDISADLSSMKLTVVKTGDDPNPNPNPNPDPTPDDHYVYYDGTFSAPQVWAWTDAGNCTTAPKWPGDNMTKKDGKWYWAVPSGKSLPTQIIIHEGDNKIGGGDLKYVDKATYHQDGTWTEGEDPNPQPEKPVVTATPGSTTFSESITVKLSATPAGSTIYYTDNGATPTTSSTKYVTDFTLTATTTIKAFAVGTDGTTGDVASFVYTKNDTPNPNPNPNPNPGDNLITDYYKVNHKGFGTERTVNMSFNGPKSTTALSNWSEKDMIAQGVARDVCQAIKGVHERPVVDSYAIYASYDDENLYLGVQFVYTVWDLYGEGKQPGESKPYNMDGRFMWAFDLDPNKSFDGYINGTKAIWNDENAPGAKFANGVDAVFIGSTKPGVGTPGLFIPTPDGHASYDAEYCKNIPANSYGYADGLLPDIKNIWGQSDFSYDPEVLKGNTGFADLTSEIDNDAHTFYEVRLPLSLLGVTKDYIKNNGIGVMYLDVYGASPVGGTPYDPAYFDNVSESYSMDSSSSKEKEDEDIITYAPARVGKTTPLSTNVISNDRDYSANYRIGQGCIEFFGLNGESVSVSSIDGRNMFSSRNASDVTVELPQGIYIINIDGAGKAVQVR